MGHEAERRKAFSAAVIGGIKRNSRIYVGDSIGIAQFIYFAHLTNRYH